MLPIIAPRRDSGTSVMTVVISSGVIIAAPTPWMTRATSSTEKVGESAASSVPSDERAEGDARTASGWSRRWIRNPLTGMTTAIVRMNAVDSHWPVLALTCRSSMSTGMATLMIVSFSTTTKAETSSTPMAIASLRFRRSGVARRRGGGAVDGLGHRDLRRCRGRRP